MTMSDGNVDSDSDDVLFDESIAHQKRASPIYRLLEQEESDEKFEPADSKQKNKLFFFLPKMVEMLCERQKKKIKYGKYVYENTHTDTHNHRRKSM